MLSPGKDGIPAEVLKCCKETLITELHEILYLCWSEGEVPQDMRDAKVVTLYKNKGDRGDCTNYRGISLLSVDGKVFARVVLKRLQVLAEQVYPESQCGFRANRSTVDMIFSLRQLQEKCREQRQPLFVASIDLTKAFDLVSRDGLFKILPKTGCPPKLLSIIRSFHEYMKGIVVFDGSPSAAFNIRSGVKQGCVLAPTLFGIFFAVMLKHAFGPAAEGIYLRTRTDGKLFNLSRLRAKTKVQLRCLRDFLFADDAAVTAHSAEDLQQLLTRFSDACQDFRLTISLKKTQVMGQDTDSAPAISINDHELDVTHDFVYLGSAIPDTLSLDAELNRRIDKAAKTMTRLTKNAWNNSKQTVHTKIQIYRTCVVSTLLYGSVVLGIACPTGVKAQCSSHAQPPTHSVYHLAGQGPKQHCPGKSWMHQHVRATETETYALARPRRAHGRRTDPQSPTGRPQLRFKDVCKRDLKASNIDQNNWKATALKRSAWRQTVQKGLSNFEETLAQRHREKRMRRKAAAHADRPASDFVCVLCHRDCHSRIGLVSHNRRCTRKKNT